MARETRNIALHSYDDHYRPSGIATMPWSKISRSNAQRVRVSDIKRIDKAGDHQVYAQVDAIDPDDRSLDMLTVLVDDWIEGGGLHYGVESWRVHLQYTIDERIFTDAEIARHQYERQQSEKNTHSFFVHNEGKGHIGAYVFLPAGPKRWQGGAITSVLIDGTEILDAPAAEHGVHNHDPEKRLQLDRVTLANPPWAATPFVEKSLYKDPWTFVAAGDGPVRMWVNIRSPSFTFHYEDVHGVPIAYECHLYRVISVFRHADYLVEDLYVRGTPPGGAAVRLNFAPHYFLKMQFQDYPRVTQVPLIPDWFSIGTMDSPRPGFGFASTVPCIRIDNPPADYPNKDQAKAAFGWQLGYAYSVRCVHLFRRWTTPWEISNDTGRAWFELMFKPLRGSVV